MSRPLACWLAISACSVDPDAAEDNDDVTDGDDDDDEEPPPPVEPSPLDGAWEGGCVGDVVLTYTSSTYSQSLDLAGILTLEEAIPGVVAGDLAFTLTYSYTTTTTTSTAQGVLLVAGSRDGPDVHLDFLGYTSTFTPGSTYEFPAWIDLTLDGDTLDGAIVFAFYTYDQESDVPCSFTRLPSD